MRSDAEKAVILFWRILWCSVGIGAGVFLLYYCRAIVVSVLVAVLLTYVLLPFVEYLCRKRKTRVGTRAQRLLATLLVFGVFLALVGLGVTMVVRPIGHEVEALQGNAGHYAKQVSDSVASVGLWYEKTIPPHIQQAISGRGLATNIADYAQGLLKFATSSIGVVLELVLIPVLAFYFLLDYRSITHELYALVPRPRRRDAIRMGRSVGEILQSYIFGQIILCGIAGGLTGLFLAALGMPYVIVLALFAGITRAIPIIGPVASGIPIVLVGLLNMHGNHAIPVYLLGFTIIMHFAESKFIMPRLIGSRLHLHPAVVIIVLLIGAEFFGLMGMFLAAPVAAVIRELIRFYYIRPRQRAEETAESTEAVSA